MEKFNKEDNLNFEIKDPQRETFKGFYRKQEEIIKIANYLAPERKYFCSTDGDIYIFHLDKTTNIDWVNTPLINQGNGGIFLDSDESRAFICKKFNFDSKIDFSINLLTDRDILDEMRKDHRIAHGIKTFYIFNENGDGKKIHCLNKENSLTKYFKKPQINTAIELEIFAYFESEFSGGDLEILDFALFKLKERLNNELEKWKI